MKEPEAELNSRSIEKANAQIVDFLIENEPIYRDLHALRRKGWENPKGDEFFANQRRVADTATRDLAEFFYEMMQKIARDMDDATGVLRIPTSDGDDNGPNVLDFCAAPGGFLEYVTRVNPAARVRAFSLPVSQTGHEVLMSKRALTDLEFLDITMLAEDMGVKHIPQGHPDADAFVSRRLADDVNFDLILCDGQVLRGHRRAEYRENSEPIRLSAVQLALGLKHVKAGGTMVILLHKLEAWDTVATILRFSRFSKVQIFKPWRQHTKRSSFYLIAEHIHSDHPEALKARDLWKDSWEMATFNTKNQDSYSLITKGLDVNEVLQSFGQQLIEYGKGAWLIQAKALARAPFMK